MQRAEIEQLYEYDLWATGRVLDAAGKLDASAFDQFIAARGHGIGSARDLIVHIADAQLFWLQRLAGDAASMPDRERLSSLEEIRAHCEAANQAVRDFLATQSDADLQQVFEFQFRPDRPATRIRRDHLFHHIIGHGIHHRAEASELLTAAGSPPQSLDMMAFYRLP